MARAHRSTLAISLDAVSFPTEERYGFTSQLRRHATSSRIELAEPRHRDLTDRATEAKRVLASLIQTLTADG